MNCVFYYFAILFAPVFQISSCDSLGVHGHLATVAPLLRRFACLLSPGFHLGVGEGTAVGSHHKMMPFIF